MALTTALPIYKTTYDLLTVVTPLTANMPRAHKATLGKRLAEESMDLVVLIYRANSARDKAPHLQQLLERMQVVELLLRLAMLGMTWTSAPVPAGHIMTPRDHVCGEFKDNDLPPGGGDEK